MILRLISSFIFCWILSTSFAYGNTEYSNRDVNIDKNNNFFCKDKSGKPITGKVVWKHGNGNLKMVLNYLNGELHGDAFVYYENDKLSRETFYKNGKEHGLKIDFDEQGNIAEKPTLFINGVEETHFFVPQDSEDITNTELLYLMLGYEQMRKLRKDTTMGNRAYYSLLISCNKETLIFLGKEFDDFYKNNPMMNNHLTIMKEAVSHYFNNNFERNKHYELASSEQLNEMILMPVDTLYEYICSNQKYKGIVICSDD